MVKRSITTARKCPECGERSPAQFDLCWSCGATLQEQPPIDPVAAAIAVQEPEVTATSTASELPEPQELAEPTSAVSSSNWMRLVEFVAVLLLTLGHAALWWLRRGSNKLAPSDWNSIIQIPELAAWAVVLWVLVRKDSAAMQPQSLASTRWFRELLLALPIAACGVMLTFAVSIISRALDIPYVPIDQDRFTPSTNIPLIIVFYLIAAAYEEVLFRVYLQSKLLVLLRGRALPAIFLTAALFSLSHFYPMRQSISTFPFGSLYGALFYWFRSTPRLVFAHWFHNLLIAIEW